MGTRGFQEKARSTATELERCHQERSQENGHQLGRGWRGCGGQEGLEESCRPMHLWREMNQEPGIAELFLYNTPCLRKNGAFLFLLELCQISTNFNVLVSRWQKGWNCILHIHFPPHLTMPIITIRSISHKLCGRLFTICEISTANLRILWRYLRTELRNI